MSISKSLKPIRHLTLYALVFSLPFDSWLGVRVVDGLANSNVLSILYLGLCVISFNKLFVQSKALLSLCLLWAFLFVSNTLALIINGSEFSLLYTVVFTQSLLVFWMILNEIYHYEDVRLRIYLSFLASLIAVFVLVGQGVGIQASRDDAAGSLEAVTRLWFFGMNPNNLGNLAALGILLSVGLFYEIKSRKKYLLLLLPIPFASLLSFSGSAGAAVSLLISISVFFLFRKGKVHVRLSYYVAAILTTIFFINYISGNEYLSGKLISFLQSGTTTGRGQIWYQAVNLFLEHPILGVGFTGSEDKLYALSGFTTAHNVFLDVLLWGGVLALCIYCYFNYMIFKASLRSARSNSNTLYLAIFFLCLTFLLKSGGGFYIKYIWILLATIAEPLRSPNSRTKFQGLSNAA